MAAVESEPMHVDNETGKDTNETSTEDEQQQTVLTLESILTGVVIFMTIFFCQPKLFNNYRTSSFIL